ncbi:hypothetical protein EDB19DRAFT_1904285 [Suillus lakei]|nr:hypothetical protein EDB19DRAFT_1904285 [Suillus lakei]
MSVTLISRLMLNLHKSIDAGIFSTPALDDGLSLAVLTTGVNVQSAISSHHCWEWRAVVLVLFLDDPARAAPQAATRA